VLKIKKCCRCGEVKSLTSFYKHPKLSDGRRPECSECSKKARQKFISENPYLDCINKLADNILKRTVHDIDKPKNKSYKERGIKCLLGSNRVEVRENLNKHYGHQIKYLLNKGLKPSVDRIDPYGHYELGNIQIITLQQNILRADHSHVSQSIRVFYPDGKQKDFPSILAASKEIGCKRDTIYAALERPEINRRGLRFELLKKNA
jgi:hypothetical protein